MDSREIEAQIKGLLGLQLGSEAAESTVPPGAYPRHKNRYGSALSTPKFQNWFRQLKLFIGSTDGHIFWELGFSLSKT